MKNLSKDEMKKVMGGVMAPPGCQVGETTWHCTVGSQYPENYTCQNTPSSGGCGGAQSCRVYCATSSGSTYWP